MCVSVCLCVSVCEMKDACPFSPMLTLMLNLMEGFVIVCELVFVDLHSVSSPAGGDFCCLSQIVKQSVGKVTCVLTQ